ncbi:S24 family peptidase [Bradyrhizobium sp. 2TAF24]|uniref:S24 family peptidase n=1 Tax=Bradyrhizobium sp. 2TAF24 TaxID=3233011 RepID=UPI003F9376F0
MLTHEQIWTAIDRLATRAGMSPSGLARRAGLDPTTFNKSKRVTGDGRARWPSTESLAKALGATDTGLDTFVRLMDATEPDTPAIPLISLARATAAGHFDGNGHPAGDGWGRLPLPSGAIDPHLFALEISGDALSPTYRDGDVVVVAPDAPIRPGDRVVVNTADGRLAIHELHRRSARNIEFKSLGAHPHELSLAAGDLAWIARIVWVRQ